MKYQYVLTTIASGKETCIFTWHNFIFVYYLLCRRIADCDGSCTVYLWKKDKGHIALKADGGQYISFWPAHQYKKLQSGPAKWFPSLNEEIRKYGHPRNYDCNGYEYKSNRTLVEIIHGLGSRI